MLHASFVMISCYVTYCKHTPQEILGGDALQLLSQCLPPLPRNAAGHLWDAFPL